MARLLQAAAVLLVLGTSFVSAQDPECYKLPDLLDKLELTGAKKLLQLMVETDKNFQDVLDEARPLTFFAPTDAAIAHRGWQLGLKNFGDDVSGANSTLVWPILQYHIVQGAGIDFVNYPSTLGTFFYTDLGESPCLEGVMPVGLTVDKLVNKALNADKNPDLLVSAVRQTTPVLYSISTCNGISKVYVIDDVLTPCCTQLFDLRLSPALRPVFDSDNALPMAKRFFQNVATKVFVENAPTPEEMWKLPKTLVIPMEEALNMFLNDTVGEKPDGRKAVKLYSALSNYHLSNTSATKREVLTAGSLPLTSWSSGNKTCETQFTIQSYADKGGIPKLRVQAGNNTVEVTAVFEMCGNSTLYIVDKPLLPCDWEEIIPCTEYFDVQDDPRVQALINDTAKDPAKEAFSSVFAGYLTDGAGAGAAWQLPNTLIIPDAAAVSKLVSPYLKYDESGDGKPDLYNKYSLGLMKALSEYHMSQDVVKNDDLAAGKSVTLTMDLANNASQSCQQTITITPTAAPAAANGKPAVPALKITAGNSTATVLRSWQLCSTTNVYVIDNILMPCKLQELLPCTEFFEVQRYEELKAVTSSQDPVVKAFMGQFAGAVTQGEGAAAKWVLPKTVFFPTEAAIKAALPQWIGSDDLTSYKAQLIFQLVAYYHMSDSASGAKLLRSSLSRSLNLTTWLSGNSSRSCQQDVTLTYALDPRTNKQTDQLVAIAGNSTARVTNSFETCGGTNVYLVDSLLMPCGIEEFLPCTEYFSVIKEDVFKPFYETQDKWVKAFREWMSGKIYKNKRWNLPGVLFVPNSDAIANSLQPWLKANIGNKLFTNSRKAVWETMASYYMGVEPLDFKTFMQEAAVNPDITFNMTTRLALNISHSPCPQYLTVSVSNDTGSPAIKITSGGSTANVVAHYELCYSRNVWVIDNALFPCMMSQTFKAKFSAAGMLGQGMGVAVAAAMALLMLAVRW